MHAVVSFPFFDVHHVNGIPRAAQQERDPAGAEPKAQADGQLNLQIPPKGTLVCPTVTPIESPRCYFEPFDAEHVKVDKQAVRDTSITRLTWSDYACIPPIPAVTGMCGGVANWPAADGGADERLRPRDEDVAAVPPRLNPDGTALRHFSHAVSHRILYQGLEQQRRHQAALGLLGRERLGSTSTRRSNQREYRHRAAGPR